MVNYLDTQSHTFLFEVVFFLGGSVLGTIILYLGANYLSFLGYYKVYTDNFNIRFFLTFFMIIMIIFMAKYITIIYEF